jgi:3-deoxy-D-manno-octulosonic-acid transferase
MRLLYSLLLIFLLPAYGLARIFSKQARLFAKTRSEGKHVIRKALLYDGPLFWLHGSSAGELDQALAIAREIRRRKIEGKILITVFSLSVKRLPAADADFTAYLPIDFPWAWRMIQTRKNALTFITFTWDVYPNLLHRIRKMGGSAYLCSAALPANSWRIKHSRWLRPVYADFNGIGAVDEANRTRFLQLLPDESRVAVTGDTRYDTIFYKLEHAPLAADDAKRLTSAQPLLILASTYEACDERLLPHTKQWLDNHPDLDLWIFPHHVDEHRLAECERSLKRLQIDFKRYSEGPARVVLVDRLGLLARAYEKARYCYVGGAFHHRVHNTAEPAALGVSVLTGPQIETSPIALQLESEGTLFRRDSGAEIFATLDDLEKDEKRRLLLSQKSRRYMLSQRGASEVFLDAFRVGQ